MTIECSQNVHSMFISKAIITLYKNFANSFVRDLTDLRGLGYWKRDDAGGQNSSAGKMKKCRFLKVQLKKMWKYMEKGPAFVRFVENSVK